MKNNKGFSLVELLVVVAILGVVAVSTTLSYSVVRNADVRKAATTTGNMMKSVRTECLSKESSQFLYIYMDNDDYYYATANKEETSLAGVKSIGGTKLCADSISISVETASGSASAIGSGDFASISFEKGTGKVRFNINGTSGELTGINFSRGSKSSSITVAYETGKNTIHE